MRYKIPKKLEVLSFRVSSNELSYADKSKNLIFRGEVITTNTSDSGYFLANQYFFYSNENDYNTYLIDVKTDKTINLGYMGYPSEHLFDGEIFVTHEYLDLIDFKQQLISYNIKTNEKKVIKPDIGAILLHNKKVITKGSAKIIRSLSLLTGEYEWEVDLGGRFYDFHGERKEADVQNVIGVWQDWLLVSLSNHTLIALETSTGKIVWEQIPWAGYPSLKGGLAMPVLEKDSLFWYSYNAYFEFHLPTQKGILHQEYPHTDKSMPPFYIQRSVFLGDYVYFIASHKSYILNNIVGVFNRKTLQIDWQEEMDILPPQKQSDIFLSLTQIQATTDKIYVLDTGGTLYIFEREE